MTKTEERPIYGWFVIYDRSTGEEAHRIPVHYPEGSSPWNKVDDALVYKVDYERFWSEWLSASEESTA